MALEIPHWLNKDFFKDVVSSEVKDMQVSLATAKGDNYASVMYRVKLELENGEEISMIVKAFPTSGLPEEFLKNLNLFPKETEMFVKIIPAFEQLFKNVGKEVSFGPKCLKASADPTNFVVMEDLKERHFQMAKRQNGLDMDHTKLILEKLAEFHAASAVHQEQHGKYSAHFENGMYGEKGRLQMETYFMGDFQKAFRSIMRAWPFGSQYVDLMEKNWGDDQLEMVIDCYKYNDNGFNVLNHGDLWCNNAMFLYDENKKPTDLIFVDFQISNWGSPAIDLNYFIFSSVRQDIRLKELDFFIRYYYEHLTENLTLLGYSKELPTLKQLNFDFKDRLYSGFMTSLGTLPICLIEELEEDLMQGLLNNDESGMNIKRKMYNTPSYISCMEELLPYFHNMGLFYLNPPKVLVSNCGELPDWFQDTLFFEIVEKELKIPKGLYKIKKINVELLESDPKFGTVLHKAVLNVADKRDGSIHNFSCIIKSLKSSENSEEDVINFKKEIDIFGTIIPEFEKFFTEKEDRISFTPKCLQALHEKSAILILEDFRSQDFTKIERKIEMDLEAIETIIVKLAKFHAASAVYAEKNGKNLKSFSRKEMNEDDFNKMATSFVGAIKNCQHGGEQFGDSMETLNKIVLSKTNEILKPKENGFNVLNHGDVWCKNIENKAGDVLLNDFHDSYWSSPVNDLISLLFSAPCSSIRIKKLDYFVYFYHKNLVETLKLLGYVKEMPTLNELHHDLIDRLVFGYYTITTQLPITLMDHDENISLKEALCDNEEIGMKFRNKLFYNKRYVEAMKDVLPYFRNIGVLQ